MVKFENRFYRVTRLEDVVLCCLLRAVKRKRSFRNRDNRVAYVLSPALLRAAKKSSVFVVMSCGKRAEKQKEKRKKARKKSKQSTFKILKVTAVRNLRQLVWVRKCL